ncbi:hypothetical protein TRFO_14316 [Tritrichomonas foetus]|uniref:Potassium channel domain-containing protein n=1 Tax=Tritrichomonas foetus TaxID=1144522 RepID=A0A1J4KV14_9EUKA|nr:hypothetical protein TRFO_14316 [Tritrichomonas foetus]|eukprot:OHT15153.1 hypothetical protein TRFO_14316 [Tritrichomonas foetus]
MLPKNIDFDEKNEILTNEKLIRLTNSSTSAMDGSQFDAQLFHRRKYEMLYANIIHHRQRLFQQSYITLMIVLNLLVIILTIFRNELIIEKKEYQTSRMVISILCTCISVVSIVIIILRFSLLKQNYNSKFTMNLHFFRYLTFKRKWIQFLLEIIINTIHPFPFVDNGMKYITMLVFLRLYPLFWGVTYFSRIYRNRDEVQKAIETMGGYKMPKFNVFLAFKEMMHTHAIISLIGISVIVIPSYAYILYNSEKNIGNSTVSRFPPTIYWGIITLTTVGYGDIHPSENNPPGMVIACVAALTGTLIISMLSAVISSALSLSESEKVASQAAHRIVLQNQLRLISAQMIQTAVRLRRKPKNIKLKKNFYRLAIIKNQLNEQLKSQMGYSDSFIAADAITELFEFTGAQEQKYKGILEKILNIRKQVAITTNVFGVVRQK